MFQEEAARLEQVVMPQLRTQFDLPGCDCFIAYVVAVRARNSNPLNIRFLAKEGGQKLRHRPDEAEQFDSWAAASRAAEKLPMPAAVGVLFESSTGYHVDYPENPCINRTGLELRRYS